MTLDGMIEFVSGLRRHLASWRPLVPERKMTAIDERLWMVAEALKAAKKLSDSVRAAEKAGAIVGTQLNWTLAEFDQVTGRKE